MKTVEKYDLPKPNCPVCGRNDEVIRIMFGFPSESSFEKARKREIYLGGCIFPPSDDCHWVCKRDQKKF